LRRIVAERMAALHGGPPDDIVLAPPYTVLKTSSGKLRRAACRELYEQGMKHAGPSALWLQSLRLAGGGAAGIVHRVWMRFTGLLFGAYTWALMVPLGLVALALAALLPGLARRRRAARGLARGFVAASGLPVHIAGDEHFPAAGPMLIVANHASYLDGIVLTAFLPVRCQFVAKRELERSLAMRLVLRGIGTRFVERFDVEGSVEAAHEMQALAASGESLVFFPEGTFRREPGLRPFHMGAFVAAAAAEIPVIPVALRGMRSVLRDGQWLPRRGIVQIVVDPPLVPDGRDWNAAVRLRDRARAAILAGCGEPDLTH
jgi:1-acyl-sn-glycerol-3-phosphate acyltransferase